MKFEYVVCQVQQMRVTFANGEWQGSVPMNPSDTAAALASCPLTWEYLQSAGEDGWDLVAVNTPGGAAGTPAFTLYLKRAQS